MNESETYTLKIIKHDWALVIHDLPDSGLAFALARAAKEYGYDAMVTKHWHIVGEVETP